jgi:gluconokinase
MTMLAIDIGSSSVRALLFDASARPVPGAQAERAHRFRTQPPGAAIADAEELRAAVESCVDTVLGHPAAGQIDAVGMDTFAGNLLGVGADGDPVTPIYTYADTRSAEDARLLREQVDQADVLQRTGCPIHTGYHPARLHWLRRTQPKRFAATIRWTDFGTYLYGKWFGDAPCSTSVASWSGLLNRTSLGWDAAWLDVLEVSADALPALADYSEAQTGLIAAYARRWPGLRDAPFYLAVGDGAAANVGQGATENDEAALTVGTTAALRKIVRGGPPRVPAGLWCYRVDVERHLLGGATSEGGNVFAWAGRTLQLPDADAIEAALAGREPGEHGLTVLPLLAGERAPGWALDATGAIAGLRLGTSPLDILHALLESVALRMAAIGDALLGEDDVIHAGGHALAASPAWAQMFADALGRPLHLQNDDQPTARGTALLALQASGAPTPEHRSTDVDTVTVAPRPEFAGRYRILREQQADLYNRLISRRAP